MAYSFDFPDIVDEFTRCRTRRVEMQLIIDKSQGLGKTTHNVRPAVIRLLSHGVTVKVLEGRDLEPAYAESSRSAGRASGRAGISHAKTLHTESVYMCGSCNWTQPRFICSTCGFIGPDQMRCCGSCGFCDLCGEIHGAWCGRCNSFHATTQACGE